MKVFEIISDTNIGGAGILLVTRLRHCDRSEFQTTVVLPRNSALKPRFDEIRIPVIEINGCADRSFDISAVAEFCTLLRKYRPDLINCHGCLTARIAARLCCIPCIVYTRHCAYPPSHWQSSRIGKKIVGGIQHLLSDQIIAVAQAAKKNLTDIGVSPNRIQVIVNGSDGLQKISREEQINYMNALGFPQGSIVIGICARLEPCKGHMDLLRAAKLLLRTSRSYRFLIVGDGRFRRNLEEYCQSNGLLPYVRFVGFQKDVTPFVNLFYIQVNCSVGTETSSLALSEGMSIGIPSVVSNYGGNPHMVKNGVNGLIYPVRRYDCLAKRIQQIAENPKLHERLSKGACQRFEKEFRATEMTRKTEQLYRSTFIRCSRRAGKAH